MEARTTARVLSAWGLSGTMNSSNTHVNKMDIYVINNILACASNQIEINLYTEIRFSNTDYITMLQGMLYTRIMNMKT